MPRLSMKELKEKVDARIKANGIRSKFAIYEDVKSMLRLMSLSGTEYEQGIKFAVDNLNI